MVSPEFKGQILMNENQFLLREQYRRLLAEDPNRSPMNFDLPIWQHDEQWVRDQILLNGESALGIHGEVLTNFLNSSRDQSQYEIILEGLMHIFEEFNAGTPIEEYVHHADFLKYIGTAQGSPLSPYLAALSLTQISERLPEGVKILFYADDFILYGSGLTDTTLEEVKALFAEAGFAIHGSKSRWVVKDGGLITSEIKFLGLSYFFELGILAANTRKGSRLVFTKSDLLDFEYDKLSSLTQSAESLWKESRKFYYMSWARLVPNVGLSSALGKYYRALSFFRKWFITEFQWDLLALLLRLLDSPFWMLRRFITIGAFNLTSVRTAQAFAKVMYSEERRISTVIDESDTKDVSRMEQPYSLDPGIFQAINYVNPYLRRYRSKYTFVNFCASRFRGTILARMYSGSWLQSMPLQRFGFSYSKYSLAQLVSVFLRKPNIFVGSSIASNLLVRALSSANRSKRFNQKFQRSLIENARKLRYDILLLKVG
jgi:hypothetical protein